jgi:hypothetical protein
MTQVKPYEREDRKAGGVLWASPDHQDYYRAKRAYEEALKTYMVHKQGWY